MAVTGDGHESRDALLADEVVDLAALDVRGGVIAAGKRGRVSGSRPGLRQPRGQILRIGAHVERGRRVAPDLPRRLRVAAAAAGTTPSARRPRTSARARPCGSWRLLRRRTKRRRRAAAVVCVPASRISIASCGISSGKSFAQQRLRLRPPGRLFRAIAALIGDDELDVASPAQRAIAGEAAERAGCSVPGPAHGRRIA